MRTPDDTAARAAAALNATFGTKMTAKVGENPSVRSVLRWRIPAAARCSTLVRALSLIALTLTSLACGASAQSSPGQDLRSTIALLREVHPRLYRYVDESALSASVEAEAVRLDALSSANELDLGLSLHRVLARVGDAHLAVGFQSLQPGAENPPPILPLLPKTVGDRVMVDASDPAVPIGTELVAIDERPIAAVMAALEELAFVDGDNANVRRARADRHFPRLFLIESGGQKQHEIQVRLPDGEARTLQLTGVGREQIAALERRRHSAPVWGARTDRVPLLPWTVPVGDDTVLLRAPSFGVGDQEGYADRVDALFAELSGSENLIIDLRGNEGGFRTNGIAILNRLLDQPYAQWTRVETRVRRVPAGFRNRVTFDIAPEAERALRGFPGEPEGGRFVFEGDPLAERMRPTGPRHSGPVTVFIDDATNSAAVEFLAALLANRPDVQVVGTETRGECARHIGEFPAVYTTEHLGVVVLFSMAELTHVPVARCRLGRGFEPDTVIEYDMSHFFEGRDPFLSAIGLESGGLSKKIGVRQGN